MYEIKFIVENWAFFLRKKGKISQLNGGFIKSTSRKPKKVFGIKA